MAVFPFADGLRTDGQGFCQRFLGVPAFFAKYGDLSAYFLRIHINHLT
jgi:hypothetical protein